MSDVDVAVVGAGPGGSALAAMLGAAGVSTMLFDRSRFPRDKACGEGLMPSGVEVLERMGLDLGAFPPLDGVSYRIPGAGSASGRFARGRVGRAVRRVAFDGILAGCAASTPNVDARFGCAVASVLPYEGGVRLTTDGGDLSARFAVGADGLRSRVARSMGWRREPRSARYALVGHGLAPGHALDRVVVTLLDGCEVYAAPTSAEEVLVAVLARKDRLRRDGERARDAYTRIVASAHPEIAIPPAMRVHGAGPFWIRPRTVAGRGVFLLGDSAGFLDPLTGDGMSDALVAAEKLAGIIASGRARPEDAYRRWEAGRWRRRVFVNRLALALTGSSTVARRALRTLQRRPSTLNRLLAINDGTQSVWSLSLRDWSALAGI